MQMLKKDVVAAKESTQSVRERNRSLEQFKRAKEEKICILEEATKETS